MDQGARMHAAGCFSCLRFAQGCRLFELTAPLRVPSRWRDDGACTFFQPVVGGMHRSRPLAGSSAHAPFPAVGGINNVAAIQPAVGGGAVVAAPAVGGLAPAIGAGGGGG